MYLAINYSPAAAQLVQSGQLNVDYFKSPDWQWMVDEAIALRPVAVHFTLEAGNGGLEQMDWELVERLSSQTGTPYINLHLDSRLNHFPGVPIGTTDPDEVKRVADVLLSDVMFVADCFGASRVIVENSPYRADQGKTLRPCVEPEIITRIIEETGCGLLLDIAHASITAHHIGMDEHEYISRLPFQQVNELHFAGIHLVGDMLQDHQSILDANWPLLDWVLARVQSGEWSLPWMLAFEYGGVGPAFDWRCDPQVIEQQVPLLYERVEKLNKNIS